MLVYIRAERFRHDWLMRRQLAAYAAWLIIY